MALVPEPAGRRLRLTEVKGLVLGAALLVALAGCGAGSGDGDRSGQAVRSGAPSPSAPAAAPAQDRLTDRWWLATQSRAPDRELELMVHETACATGASAEGRIESAVEYSDDSIIVSISVRYRGGDQACPGNPDTSFRLVLDEPVGDRTILDARTSPPSKAGTGRPAGL